MIQNDHINLFPSNPLIGKNIEELGTRFPDMSEAYDPGLIQIASDIANENDIKVPYIPNLSTHFSILSCHQRLQQ